MFIGPFWLVKILLLALVPSAMGPIIGVRTSTYGPSNRNTNIERQRPCQL